MADLTATMGGNLIAAERVNGTNVYNLKGEKLGPVGDGLEVIRSQHHGHVEVGERDAGG